MDKKTSEIYENVKKEVRPWGNFEQYSYNQQTTVKILTVLKGQVLSKQLHRHRDELWVVIDDGLQIELDDEIVNPLPGDKVVIMRNTKHRLRSTGGKAGRVLEISFGDFDEEDIKRFDDQYGRE